jgi:hypothetical protein
MVIDLRLVPALSGAKSVSRRDPHEHEGVS